MMDTIGFNFLEFAYKSLLYYGTLLSVYINKYILLIQL
jgi:hypothetical protein